jgi:hypothetical protein
VGAVSLFRKCDGLTFRLNRSAFFGLGWRRKECAWPGCSTGWFTWAVHARAVMAGLRFGSLMAYMEFRQQNGEIGRAEQYPSPLFLLTVNQLGELKSSQENRVGGAGGWGK